MRQRPGSPQSPGSLPEYSRLHGHPRTHTTACAPSVDVWRQGERVCGCVCGRGREKGVCAEGEKREEVVYEESVQFGIETISVPLKRHYFLP